MSNTLPVKLFQALPYRQMRTLRRTYSTRRVLHFIGSKYRTERLKLITCLVYHSLEMDRKRAGNGQQTVPAALSLITETITVRYGQITATLHLCVMFIIKQPHTYVKWP